MASSPRSADSESPDETPGPQTVRTSIERFRADDAVVDEDLLAIEEPLEISLVYGPAERRNRRSISITMRTPGHDFELACGLLFGEGLIRGAAEIARVKHCGVPVGPLRLRNVVRVELAPHVEVDLARLERHFYTSSSCGVCGKTSIEALYAAGAKPIAASDVGVDLAVLRRLPERLRSDQDVFQSTGGVHASALFDAAGTLQAVREDVGRHNALDKLIGAQLLTGRLAELPRSVLLLSGRASFELIQKAAVAGIPIVAAIGAPSSLAVDLARSCNITLAGFLRADRCSIYSGSERIRSASTSAGGGRS